MRGKNKQLLLGWEPGKEAGRSEAAGSLKRAGVIQQSTLFVLLGSAVCEPVATAAGPRRGGRDGERGDLGLTPAQSPPRGYEDPPFWQHECSRVMSNAQSSQGCSRHTPSVAANKCCGPLAAVGLGAGWMRLLRVPLHVVGSM